MEQLEKGRDKLCKMWYGPLKLAMKMQVSGIKKNKLGDLPMMDFFSLFMKKIESLSVFEYPTEPTLRPKLSPFKFLFSSGILASALGLAAAVKISNLYPQASKLDI